MQKVAAKSFYLVEYRKTRLSCGEPELCSDHSESFWEFGNREVIKIDESINLKCIFVRRFLRFLELCLQKEKNVCMPVLHPGTF